MSRIVTTLGILVGCLLPMSQACALGVDWTLGWQMQLAGDAEIVAFDASTNIAAVTQASDELALLDGTTGTPLMSSPVLLPGAANSVAAYNGVFAVAVENAVKTDPGQIVFYDSLGMNLGSVSVGALPDMLTFTPDGTKVLVANEGEPNSDYTVDPVGSISIIDVSGGFGSPGVTTATFAAFSEGAIEANYGRIFGPNASVEQDLEPEYIAISPDGSTAVVTLQENNAVAVVDIASGTVTDVHGLGRKSWAGLQIDPSNQDAGAGQFVDPAADYGASLFGLYQPDSIASATIGGQTYYFTANEGDAREYIDDSVDPEIVYFNEDTRIGSLTVAGDPAYASDSDKLGRLKTTNSLFEPDDQITGAPVTELYNYGARSFSVLDAAGNILYDSGDLVETTLFAELPGFWDDGRSDDKGPEPEALTLGVLELPGGGALNVLFLGLERTTTGVVQMWNVNDPLSPSYLGSLFTDGAISPEGLSFVSADDNGGQAALFVANEVSGHVLRYNLTAVPEPASAVLLGLVIGGAGALARRRRGR